jgi:hypothetical protein
MDELHAYRNEVQAAGGSTADADALVQAIAHAQDLALLPQLFARLGAESDRLGWSRDSDYAALALQAAYVQTASAQLRSAMLGFALERARWCASCATAGGEGLARSRHIRALEALARSDVQPFAPGGGFAPG